MVLDILLIVLAALGGALLSEGVSWLLIYRTESYKNLKANIDRIQAKVDKKKATPALASKNTKKIDRYEESLKGLNRDMSMSKMKSVFAVGVTMIGLFGIMNSTFDGKVVAKLPFEPILWITGLSHRNLPGSDYTDSAMMFIYVISSMSIRNNLQKILGTTPPKGSSPFGIPTK